MSCVLITLFIIASYVSFPVKIDSASAFEDNIGNRVRFTAAFDGWDKPGEVILLGDTAIMMQTRPTGRFDWPEIGDVIDVVGRVDRGNRYYGEPDLVLRDASWTIKSQLNDQRGGEP
ncbi:hypothetical protein SH528x_003483 [Novipirellula sp. SH528]|uniref:hypothetical protein n=1 Tax=Novipirellula sp. SH528 TaxID=3454466 RepID=UPI003FA0D330